MTNFRSILLTSALISILSLILSSFGCGKKKQKEFDRMPVIGNEELPITEKKPDGQNEANAIAKKEAVDSEKLLKGLIEQEKQERIKKDKELGKRIDGLESNLYIFKSEVEADIKRLDEKDKQLEERIDVNAKSIDESLGELELKVDENLKKAIVELDQSLKSEFTKQLKELSESTNTNNKALEEKLMVLIKASSKETKESFKALQINLRVIRESQNIERKEVLIKIYDARESLAKATAEDKKVLIEKIAALEADQKRLIEQQKLARDEIVDKMVSLIDKKDQATRSEFAKVNLEIESLNENLIAKSHEIEQKIESSAENMEAKLKLYIESSASELESSLLASREKALLELEKSGKENVDELKKKVYEDYAKLKSDLLQLAKDQEIFKNQVVTTYATKAELKKVNLYVENLKDITNILGKKMDENDKDLRNLIGAESKIIRDEFIKKVNIIESSISDLEAKLIDRIDVYAQTTKQEFKKIDNEIKGIRADILDARGDFLEENNLLKEELMNKLKGATADFELITQNMKLCLSNKILEISAKIDATDKDLQESKEKAQKQFNKAVAEEQAYRTHIQDQLDIIAKDLQKLAEATKIQMALSEANAKDIASLRNDFEKEKQLVAQRFKVQKNQLDEGLALLRNEFDEKIKAVADHASLLVVNLGKDVQKQFGGIATELADLEQKQIAAESQFEQYVSKIEKDAKKAKICKDNLSESKKEVIDKLVLLREEIAEVELEFIKALNPDQNKPDFYDQAFKPIMLKCDGIQSASFANAMGKDSFQFLAKEYLRNLIIGIKDYVGDDIFFGKNDLLGNNLVQKYLLMDLLRYKSGSDSESCIQDIASWGRKVLFADNNDSKRIRTVIVNNANLQRSIKKLKIAVNNIASPSKEFETNLEDCNQGKVAETIFNGMVQNIINLTSYKVMLTNNKNLYDKIIDVQNKFAQENTNLKEHILEHKAKLEGALNLFKQKMNDRINNLEGKVTNLTTSLKMALDVVASLADRAGYDDLKNKALEAGKPIDYEVKLIADNNCSSPKVFEVQHFFKAPFVINNTNACTGKAILRNVGTRGWGKCWVNFRRFPKYKWIPTMDTVFFRVFGEANQVELYNTTIGYKKSFNLKAGTLSVETKVHGSFKQGVFDLFAPKSLRLGNYVARSQTVTITPICGKVKGRSYNYKLFLYSPIVLDFLNVGTIKTTPINDTNRTKFDLDADGKKEATGWVKGSEGGFLAIDLNGDGKINNGSELFGEATEISKGRKAQNGYEALSKYDKNGDNYIDNNDPVFSRLLVWFDKNTDGITQRDELSKLGSLGVTKIGLVYKKTPVKDRHNNGNLIKYSAKFFGPQQCGKDGCNSYDIYFGTVFSLSLK